MKRKIKSVLLIFIAVLFVYSPVSCAKGKRYCFQDIKTLYPEVKTERLVLAPKKREDIDILAKYLLDKEVTQYLDDGLEEGFDDIEKAKNYLIGCESPNNLTYVIKLSDGTIIGELEYMYDFTEKKVSVAYWLGRQYWNQKYISEVALTMSNIVINATDVNEMHILYFYENSPSARLSYKIFQYLIEQNKNIYFYEYIYDCPEVHTEGHVLYKISYKDSCTEDDEIII